MNINNPSSSHKKDVTFIGIIFWQKYVNMSAIVSEYIVKCTLSGLYC